MLTEKLNEWAYDKIKMQKLISTLYRFGSAVAKNDFEWIDFVKLILNKN